MGNCYVKDRLTNLNNENNENNENIKKIKDQFEKQVRDQKKNINNLEKELNDLKLLYSSECNLNKIAKHNYETFKDLIIRDNETLDNKKERIDKIKFFLNFCENEYNSILEKDLPKIDEKMDEGDVSSKRMDELEILASQDTCVIEDEEMNEEMNKEMNKEMNEEMNEAKNEAKNEDINEEINEEMNEAKNEEMNEANNDGMNEANNDGIGESEVV